MTFSRKIHYLVFEEYRLDLKNKQLLKQDEILPLAPKDYDILLYLIENRGKVVSKKELLDKVWNQTYVLESSLVQHIYQIRKTLKSKENNKEYIKTISKTGYQFIVDVEEILENELRSTSDKSFHKKAFDIKEEAFLPIGQNIPKQNTTGTRKEIRHADDGNYKSFDKKENTKKQFGFNRHYVLGGILGTLLLIVAGGYFYLLNKEPDKSLQHIKSMAVLPFRQIGGDTDEKFGLGMADTLISHLSKQQKIAVSPTSTIIRFVDEGTHSPIEIGRILKVDAILTGTIQREDEIIRVNVQLIDIEKQKSFWTYKFDEKFSDILSLQDKVSETIANQFSIDTKSVKKDITKGRLTKNAEAHRAYSLGLFYWNKRTPESLKKAAEYFQEAVKEDSDFALGYALLADTYALIGNYHFDSTPHKTLEKAREIASKAEEINPNLSEIYTAKGLTYYHDRDVKRAKTYFKKAIELNSRNVTAHQRFALILAHEGNLDEAIREIKIAQTLDPLSTPINRSLIYYLCMARKLEEASLYLKQVQEMDKSVNINWEKAFIYEQKEDYAKALEIIETELEKRNEDFGFILIKSRILAKQGKTEESQKLLNKVVSGKKEYSLAYPVALVYLHLGNTKKALEIFDELSSDSLYLLVFKYDYNLDSIREIDEFKKIVSNTEKALRNNLKLEG